MLLGMLDLSLSATLTSQVESHVSRHNYGHCGGSSDLSIQVSNALIAEG